MKRLTQSEVNDDGLDPSVGIGWLMMICPIKTASRICMYHRASVTCLANCRKNRRNEDVSMDGVRTAQVIMKSSSQVSLSRIPIQHCKTS